jgi:nucleoid-associated protein YgaU
MPEKKSGIVSGGHTTPGPSGTPQVTPTPRVEPHDSGIVSGASSQLTTRDEHTLQSYTVVKGDSLSKIAKRVYGKASRWRDIYELNKDNIKDPDLIYPGQVLRLPEL